MKEALFYDKSENNVVLCKLCNHLCKIRNGKTGICNVRKNIDGKLFSLIYNKIAAKNIDPVEKKPLYHFLPGSYTYSISTVGCNLKCKHCQNYEISQSKDIFGYEISSEENIKTVLNNKLPSISYTYTEPTIYYETARDIGMLAMKHNVKNIFVSNGYMSKSVIDDMKNWVHGINIDLKSFSDDFYKKVCGASLKPVLENIVKLKEAGVWMEITTLVIPRYNDSDKELMDIAKFIVSVDKGIPWHVSAFYPTYLLTDTHPTSLDTIVNARLIGISEGLKYVYTGNVRDDSGSNTYCPKCNELLIERRGYTVKVSNLTEGVCNNCGEKIEGVF